jgi:hypothetical protein
VRKDLLAIATGVFKGVSKNGHLVIGSFVVDALCEGKDSGCEPRGIEADGMEGVAKDIPKETCLVY